MQAMILAAGKGERMMPLTQLTPKPLLEAGGKPLLQYHIEALAAAGVTEIIINTARFGQQIEDYFGEGAGYGVGLRYSREGDAPLGTGRGVCRVLPWLTEEAFILVNGDVWTDYDFTSLSGPPSGLAHLIMVDNPPQHPAGDFHLAGDRVTGRDTPCLTYSGIGVYRPALFADIRPDEESFVPALVRGMRQGQVSGEHYRGVWLDIGTPDRLAHLQTLLAAAQPES